MQWHKDLTVEQTLDSVKAVACTHENQPAAYELRVCAGQVAGEWLKSAEARKWVEKNHAIAR
jgi:hypothetical protein